MKDRWLLPEAIEDRLPHEALQVERLRRLLLDAFRGWGYELVMPPLLEYVESLLTGTGHDLDLQTFKLVDQLSGRTMGLRSDITPQVARIDAHLLNRSGVTRLCYCGSVLHTLPAGLNATREPLLIGAELYGCGGIEGDIEIVRLLTVALAACGVPSPRIDLGHVAVFRALARHANLSAAAQTELFEVMQSKDMPGLAVLTEGIVAPWRDALRRLPELYGGIEIIATARAALPDVAEIRTALAELETLAANCADVKLSIDLAELRGFHYHTGVVFAAYCEGVPNDVARGGRYDEVGKAFGRARPATGFSLYLNELMRIVPHLPTAPAIRAPWNDDSALRAEVAKLRAQGEIVIQEMPGCITPPGESSADRELALVDGKWAVSKLAPNKAQ
jgi:ATP phosphoribosyltransferase regulatory subunit